MQAYLPVVQAMLNEWYLFTLNNALYAAALATAVWLLTSMLYSIRIAALKRGSAASEKTSFESLNTLQQQLQHTQEELAATILLMEKATSTTQAETQRALSLEQLIYQRNKQIAEIIQTLASSFDLGERPLLASEDVKAEMLWQQHTKVITQLIERLRTEQQAKIQFQQTCQAETAKLAEKEVQLEALHTTLNSHADQLSKLELALAEQKSVQQRQNNAQQVLTDTLKNYQVAVTRPAEPAPAINTLQQSVPVEATPVATETETLFVPEVPVIQVPQVAAIPVAIETPAPEIEPHAVIKEEPYVSLASEPQPVTHAKGSFGGIKTLFGKPKPQPVKTEPQWVISKPDEPLFSDNAPQSVEEVPEKTPGKLQGFYSKFRSKGK